MAFPHLACIVCFGAFVNAGWASVPDSAGCNVSVVGAGWAGIYVAWRLLTGEEQVRQSVCLFEAYNRPGGRTYSTRIDDYVLDVGAYRFAGDMHLPADLITKALKLRSVCYDPTCNDDDVRAEVKWPYKLPLSKIVDFDGRHLGYGAALKAMLVEIEDAGGHIYLGAELHSVKRDDLRKVWKLQFKTNGQLKAPAEMASNSVLLNLPRSALERVGGLQEATSSRWPALQCSARQFPSTVTEGATTSKVYAIYEDAWWVSRLGLLRGVRENLTTSPPISIHYHDGEVVCIGGGEDAGGSLRWVPARQASKRQKCRGVLQVFYRHSQSCPSSFPDCMNYWTKVPRRNMSDPLTIVSKGPRSTHAENALILDVHQKLVEMHKTELISSGLSEEDIEALAEPSTLAYSVWYHQGTFPVGDEHMLSGPQDIIYSASDGFPSSCGVKSVEEFEDAVEGTGPWTNVGRGIHFANNDFYASSSSTWHGPWAEQSLLGAERMLVKAFGLKRPRWLNATYYGKQVLQHVHPAEMQI
eukprot:TRINITY_DN37398_c0_g1_i1.p1 TRINITY_DN37398_c0_g1~~TRINITY_DN37398_c0_g1_i1.p1  ORF type:complete len:526 (+),score=65.23 TRINITY_DN37398_c0_g1_i1:64-1641(+)